MLLHVIVLTNHQVRSYRLQTVINIHYSLLQDGWSMTPCVQLWTYIIRFTATIYISVFRFSIVYFKQLKYHNSIVSRAGGGAPTTVPEQSLRILHAQLRPFLGFEFARTRFKVQLTTFGFVLRGRFQTIKKKKPTNKNTRAHSTASVRESSGWFDTNRLVTRTGEERTVDICSRSAATKEIRIDGHLRRDRMNRTSSRK